MGTCARAARPCTRSPINAVRRGEGPFRRRRPSPRDPAEIFYSRRFLRADISSIDRPQRGCRHGPGRKRPTLRPRGPPTRENHHHRSPLHTSSRDLLDHSRSHKREIKVWFLDACFSKWYFNVRFLPQGLSLAVEWVVLIKVKIADCKWYTLLRVKVGFSLDTRPLKWHFFDEVKNDRCRNLRWLDVSCERFIRFKVYSGFIDNGSDNLVGFVENLIDWIIAINYI